MFSERAQRCCTFIYAVNAAPMRDVNVSVGGTQIARVTGA